MANKIAIANKVFMHAPFLPMVAPEAFGSRAPTISNEPMQPFLISIRCQGFARSARSRQDRTAALKATGSQFDCLTW